jgi:hypothetical protein
MILGKNFGLEKIGGFVFGVGEMFKDSVREEGNNSEGSEAN